MIQSAQAFLELLVKCAHTAYFDVGMNACDVITCSITAVVLLLLFHHYEAFAIRVEKEHELFTCSWWLAGCVLVCAATQLDFELCVVSCDCRGWCVTLFSTRRIYAPLGALPARVKYLLFFVMSFNTSVQVRII